MKVSVIGTGSFGTSLSIVLNDNQTKYFYMVETMILLMRLTILIQTSAT